MKKQRGEIVIVISSFVLGLGVFSALAINAEGKTAASKQAAGTIVTASVYAARGGSPAPRYTGVPMTSAAEPN